MPIHVMHDIETLGTGNDPVVLSIGAVKFDGDQIIDRFHVGIDPKDSQRLGLKIDAETVLWWLDPDRAEARAALLALPKVDLFSALDGYAMWLRGDQPVTGSAWANGATFDHIKLRSSYDACRLDYPFPFWREECYRTMKNRFRDIPFQRIGTYHSALDDAESQAAHLQEICKAHGIKL